MHFLVNASPPQLQTLQVNKSNNLEGTGQCFMTMFHVTLTQCHPKVKGQIIYFLVNASPLLPLAIATSNFAGT